MAPLPLRPQGLLALALLTSCGGRAHEPAGPRPLLETLLSEGAPEAVDVDASGRRLVLLTRAALDPADRDRLPDVYWVDLEREEAVLISRGLDGASADGPCLEPSLSADGGSVAFVSFASNLVPLRGEPDGMADVFVARVDPETRAVRSLVQASRPGLDPDGTGPSGHSFGPSLDASGTRVAFWTSADNLVPGDTNGDVADVVVVDLEGGEGAFGGCLVSRHALRPLAAGPPGGDSRWPVLSGDGRRLAFTSRAWNLVDEDPSQGLPDVFVGHLEGRGRELSCTALVRVPVPGEERGEAAWLGAGRAHLSADGRRVAFEVRAPLARPDGVSVEAASLDQALPRVEGLAPTLAGDLPELRAPRLAPRGGALLAVGRGPDGRSGVFRVDGSGAVERVTDPAWSPTLAFWGPEERSLLLLGSGPSTGRAGLWAAPLGAGAGAPGGLPRTDRGDGAPSRP